MPPAMAPHSKSGRASIGDDTLGLPLAEASEGQPRQTFIRRPIVATKTRGFQDKRAARDFCILAAATFLCFTTLSQSALLAVVMRAHAVPLHRIGIVLSAYGASVLVFTLIAGPVATKLGNLMTLRLGMALLLASFASYEFSLELFPTAMLSRFVQGAGYGLFMPSAMAYARSKLSEGRLLYFFGIFSAMVPLPNAIGPPLAEAYLNSFGDRWLFFVGAIPAGVGVLLSTTLVDGARQSSHNAACSLLRTAGLPSLRPPLIAILVVGALYGLILSYLAPILADKKVPVGFFYTSFTIVLLVIRLWFMRHLENWGRSTLLVMGIISMSVAYLVVAISDSPGPITVAGLLFGLGYSVAYPTLSIWVTELFKPHQRTVPLAILNAAFSLGIALTPWLGAYVIGSVGEAGLLYGLAVCGFSLLPYLLLRQTLAAARGPHDGGYSPQSRPHRRCTRAQTPQQPPAPT
jgi:MFS family permease